MSTEHGRSAPDPDAASKARSPSHAERCRTLVSVTRHGTLSTLLRDPAGYPYGSLVTVAFDPRGRPILLLSTMAEHTQNLKVSPEASLLVSDPIEGHAEPLAASRVALIGPCAPVPEEDVAAARELFLGAHPSASHYVDFKDFGFYRLSPVGLRYVGGFGRMSWITAEDYASAEADPLAPAAKDVLTHMNDDHADAVKLYASVTAKVADVQSAVMTAVDRYGFDLAVTTTEGKRAVRLAFDAPVTTTDEVRKAMVAMVRAARAASA